MTTHRRKVGQESCHGPKITFSVKIVETESVNVNIFYVNTSMAWDEMAQINDFYFEYQKIVGIPKT